MPLLSALRVRVREYEEKRYTERLAKLKADILKFII